MNTTKALAILAIVAALAVATTGTLVEPALARLPTVPPGAATASCAQGAAGQGAADCPTPPPRGGPR
jgi:hypothetical protein